MMDTQIVLDVRGLEPPEPLVMALEALPRLQPDHKMCMLIDREPFPLYRILDSNGYRRKTDCRPDFSYEVTVWLPAAECD